jgi:RecB family exonuclease
VSEEKFSFSRIESFHNCKRNYYNTYILGNRSGDSIYTYCGTVTHELTQAMIQNEITNKEAVKRFIASIDAAEMLELPWISENVKNNYVNCISHFLENFIPVKNSAIQIEDYFEINISGTIVRGYIDIWYRIGNEIYIIDLKTSTKFSKKDLPKKSRQLLLYGIAMSEKYPDCKIILQFNMMKYVLKNGKLFERNKLEWFDEEPDGIINVEYTEDSVEEVKEYVKDTIRQINLMNKDDIKQWTMGYDPAKDFFCRNLCGHRESCLQNINN